MAKQLLKPGTYLYPVPAAMITCGPVEKPNIITLAWVGTVCSDPPMVSISVRPSRHSYALIKERGEFAINLPTRDLVRSTDLCGTLSGRRVDKFVSAGLTAVPASAIATVIIAECPVNIECRVVQILPLGSHDLFLARVVAVQADESVLGEDRQIDLLKAEPFAYGAHGYWSLDELLGTYGYSAAR